MLTTTPAIQEANRSMPPDVLIPELVYADFTGAVDWLCTVLGFTERLRIGQHRAHSQTLVDVDPQAWGGQPRG